MTGLRRLKHLCLIGLLSKVAVGITATVIFMDTKVQAQETVKKKQAKSGYDYLEKPTRRIQDDDFANPGFFFVEAGSELWRKTVGVTEKSCAYCHGEAAKTMREAATRYPAWNSVLGRVINLEQRINHCRVRHMKARPLTYESDELLSLTTWVRHQSRGMPVKVDISGLAAPAFSRGKAFWFRPRGLFDVSCSQCHDDKAGLRLRAEIVSEGQTNGFPAYKLKWQKIGSSHRQFRRCNQLARSIPYAFGSQTYVDLELFLAWRGRGLKIETPAVRP
ncbi:MAG: sulfur oxidation c-type cytochrome SoxA [Rhodospirillaceae bacterium]|nr:sulfur oxidation c-type cytochrome SoxA [Rhodospirillaceae bacterium]